MSNLNAKKKEPVYQFVLHKDSISLILAITRNGLLMWTNALLPFTAHFMYFVTKEKKKVSQSLNRKLSTCM